jgi:hypothetical protein
MYISAHAKEFGDGGVAETSVDALNTHGWLRKDPTALLLKLLAKVVGPVI